MFRRWILKYIYSGVFINFKYFLGDILSDTRLLTWFEEILRKWPYNFICLYVYAAYALQLRLTWKYSIAYANILRTSLNNYNFTQFFLALWIVINYWESVTDYNIIYQYIHGSNFRKNRNVYRFKFQVLM